MYFFKNLKKSLGQNFLVDQNIINKIIRIGKIEENKTVLEIGSGSGNLTRKIVGIKAKKIIAIEKDNKLALLLKNNFKTVPGRRAEGMPEPIPHNLKSRSATVSNFAAESSS